MHLLIYIVVYPILWLFSILPFKVLYLISDMLYLLIYHVIGYRKKVVFYNLKLAFPDKSDAEIVQISKKFYHHFVDVFMEMIKSFTISKKEINKRFTYSNIELLNELYKDGKSVIIVGSHYANWEWMLGIKQFIPYNCIAAYNKIGNTYLNNRILKSRGRFGVRLKPTGKLIAQINRNDKNKVQSLYGLLSDQSPTLKKTFHWKNFFGIKVPVHTGAEMLSKKYDLNLVYIETTKIKRGHYSSTLSLLTDKPRTFENYQLSDLFLNKVEAQVKNQPEFYFWTHKRFKHKDKAPK